MRNIISKLLVLTLLCFSFVGCSATLDKKPLSLVPCNISLIDNHNFFEHTLEEDLTGNIYMLNENSKQYIVFYKMSINPKDIKINVTDNIIQIDLTKDDNYNDICLYEIRNFLNYNDSTLKIMNGPKELSINTIIT